VPAGGASDWVNMATEAQGSVSAASRYVSVQTLSSLGGTGTVRAEPDDTNTFCTTRASFVREGAQGCTVRGSAVWRPSRRTRRVRVTYASYRP